MSKTPIEPLFVTPLFPEMRAALLQVLRSLNDEQWSAPTACEGWSVKDVALHLLADDMGYLSRHRDNDGIQFSVDSWEDLLAKINHQNELWVEATRRISRNLLISLLEFTGNQLYEYLETVDLYQLSSPVSWAGNKAAPVWLHIARELTEYWMHHQHICEGAGIQSLKNRRFLHPVLSTFVHALPHTYRDVQAQPDTVVIFTVTGVAADSWQIIRETENWQLYKNSDLSAAARITMDADTAWHMFTKGIDRQILRAKAKIEGDIDLGKIALNTVAILA